MNDQHHSGDHSGGIRLQSTAIVLAAFITTLGAVTAACIQTGWFGKPETVSLPPMADSPRLAGFTPDTSEFFPTPIDKSAIIPPGSVAKLTGAITAPLVSQAAFTGKIEPAGPAQIPQQTFATARLSPDSPSSSYATPTATLTSARSSSQRPPQQNSVYYAPSAEIQTSYLQQLPVAQATIAEAPIAQTPSIAIVDSAADPNIKKLNSPWTYFAQQSADGSTAAKPAKKSLDWTSITRLFQSH
jgi:hypothetical protein